MTYELNSSVATNQDALDLMDWRFTRQSLRTRRRELGFEVLLRALGPENYERIRSWRRHGRIPNLKNPIRFNEKVSARKLYEGIPNAPMLADKIAVRSHVASLVGERYLKELYQTASDPDDIRFDLLPEAFVAKANNGSAMNILVPQKTLTDLDSIRKHLGLFLKRRVGRLKNEWWYEKIAPQILIEKYLEIEFDYRFWVFHGVAQFIVAADSAAGRLKKFDRDWQPQGDYALDASFNIPRPPRLDEMIEVAEALSSGLPFLRVDLFSPGDSEVVFGELTLVPGSGWTKRPEADDVLMGSFW